MAGSITAAYAALLALLFVVLSFRTLLRRRKIGVGVGDGDDQHLIKAARAHANFAEYVPFALLMMYFLEVVMSATTVVYVFGGLLLFGRCLHAYGVSQVEENYRYRVLGMVCTFTVLIGSALRLLVGIGM